jgi:hypothetical protein
MICISKEAYLLRGPVFNSQTAWEGFCLIPERHKAQMGSLGSLYLRLGPKKSKALFKQSRLLKS